MLSLVVVEHGVTDLPLFVYFLYVQWYRIYSPHIMSYNIFLIECACSMAVDARFLVALCEQFGSNIVVFSDLICTGSE